MMRNNGTTNMDQLTKGANDKSTYNKWKCIDSPARASTNAQLVYASFSFFHGIYCYLIANLLFFKSDGCIQVLKKPLLAQKANLSEVTSAFEGCHSLLPDASRISIGVHIYIYTYIVYS